MAATATHPTGPSLAPTLPPESRAPGTVRANRVLLGLFGLILLLVGAGTVILGAGLFGTDRKDQPLLSTHVRTMPERVTWFWPVVAVGSLLVALLALRWLLAQARSNRLSRLEVEPDRTSGHTRLDASVLASALTDEMQGYRGVRAASAHLAGRAADPRLTVRVTLDGRIDAGEIRRRVESDAVAHARTVLGVQSLPTRIELVLSRTRQRDVR